MATGQRLWRRARVLCSLLLLVEASASPAPALPLSQQSQVDLVASPQWWRTRRGALALAERTSGSPRQHEASTLLATERAEQAKAVAGRARYRGAWQAAWEAAWEEGSVKDSMISDVANDVASTAPAAASSGPAGAAQPPGAAAPAHAQTGGDVEQRLQQENQRMRNQVEMLSQKMLELQGLNSNQLDNVIGLELVDLIVRASELEAELVAEKEKSMAERSRALSEQTAHRRAEQEPRS